MSYDSMTCFVVSGILLFTFLHSSGFFLRTCYNSYERIFDIVHTDKRFSSASCKQGSFVKKVCKVCARKSCCGFCNLCKVNCFFKRFVLCVNFENFFSAFYVGVINCYLAVKSTGTEKCGVENIGTVGRCNNDYSIV